MNKNNLSDKRGQLSIFIIIAIMLVASFVLFILIRERIQSRIAMPEINAVRTYIEQCIEDTGAEVVYEIGENGGYFFPPELSAGSGVAYYYINKESQMPSKAQIENEISLYLNEKLFFCTRNFDNFPNLEIIQGEISSDVSIKSEEVVLNVRYPVRISRDNDTAVIRDFNSIKIPVRFGIVYDSIRETIDRQEPSRGICISCILEISLKNDLYVN